MSRQAVDQSKARGVVRADRAHTLCFECFRSQRDRNPAAALAGDADPAPLRSAIQPARALTTADVEHRQRMLAHLHRLSCQASG